MINEKLSLIRPGVFVPSFEVEKLEANKVAVRPVYLSICAADMRYFLGSRPKEILTKKLPLCLFHEAIGKIIYDPLKRIKKGTYCVMLPGGDDTNDSISNYREHAYFRSSTADGFSQEVMLLNANEFILLDENLDPLNFIFTELLSVCCHGLRRATAHLLANHNGSIGIWGDGVMGYTMALAAKKLMPSFKITVFGKHDEKLMKFSFVDKKINLFDCFSCNNQKFDLAIECVGGNSAEDAINECIDSIKSCGTILLTGVSEYKIGVNTRSILEKGAILIGTSRSRKVDFLQAVNLLKYSDVYLNLRKILSWEATVTSPEELRVAFKKACEIKEKGVIKIDL